MTKWLQRKTKSDEIKEAQKKKRRSVRTMMISFPPGKEKAAARQISKAWKEWNKELGIEEVG